MSGNIHLIVILSDNDKDSNNKSGGSPWSK